MILKFIIGKIDFQPELERVQQFRILLDENYELPTASSIEQIQQKLGQNLIIGNTFVEKNQTKYIFANIPQHSSGLPVEEWDFISFNKLTPESCHDYEIIEKAIKKLGYRKD
jgi:hypothetical protein